MTTRGERETLFFFLGVEGEGVSLQTLFFW